MNRLIFAAAVLAALFAGTHGRDQASASENPGRFCMEAGRAEQALFCGTGLSERERHQRVWDLFKGRTPQIGRYENIDGCQQLADSFLTGARFVAPFLRAPSLDDARFRDVLSSCIDDSFGTIDVLDDRVTTHRTRAAGPVVIFLGGRPSSSLLIELHGFQRLDRPEGEFEDLHFARLIDLKTCEIIAQEKYRQDGLIDTGLFLYRHETYRYLIGMPNNTNYYFVILKKVGEHLLSESSPKAFIYMELR